MGIILIGSDVMKIDNNIPNQINMPITDIMQPFSPTKSKDIASKVSLDPEANLDALKSIYSDKQLKKLGIIECQTCSERTYVDSSDDAGVSFKTPTKIDPKASAGAVMGHELEHVSNEQADAASEGREIISQSVMLHSAICPECGVSYVSGGVTETVSRSKTEYGLSDEMTKGLKVDNRL